MYAKEIKDNNLKAEEYLKDFKYSFSQKINIRQRRGGKDLYSDCFWLLS